MSAAGRHLKRVFRFASGLALDLLVPDVVEKVVKACQHFHRCFLVLDLADRFELFRELDAVSDLDRDALADNLLAAWQKQLPPGVGLPDEARAVAEKIVAGLRDAKDAAAVRRDPAEALRRSLNVPPPKLDADQRSGGRMTLAVRLGRDDVPASLDDAPAWPGYTYLRVLGRGGFGTVYLARHEPSGTLRAVKVGPLTEPQRFRREVALAARLNSPHLVRYLQCAERSGRFLIAMEYLGDATLADLMARPDFRARPHLLPRLATQMLAGLADLHAAGIVHRDLKPANVMIGDDFRLRLIDFGLAKPLERAGDALSTNTGAVLGTPAYMSPEQLRGRKDIAPASDVYSAGAMIYELFAGRTPHRGSSFADIVLETFTGCIDFDDGRLPPELVPFLERALSLEARHRYESAAAALAAFREPAQKAAQRLQDHHQRGVWSEAFRRRLIEAFAERAVVKMPKDPVAACLTWLSAHGVELEDVERLRQALPAVIDAARRVAGSNDPTARAYVSQVLHLGVVAADGAHCRRMKVERRAV